MKKKPACLAASGAWNCLSLLRQTATWLRFFENAIRKNETRTAAHLLNARLDPLFDQGGRHA